MIYRKKFRTPKSCCSLKYSITAQTELTQENQVEVLLIQFLWTSHQAFGPHRKNAGSMVKGCKVNLFGQGFLGNSFTQNIFLNIICFYLSFHISILIGLKFISLFIFKKSTNQLVHNFELAIK